MRPSGAGRDEEATGNLCLGSRAAVQERVGKFLAGLSSRKDEVRRRLPDGSFKARRSCETPRTDSHHPENAHPTLALFRCYHPGNAGLAVDPVQQPGAGSCFTEVVFA